MGLMDRVLGRHRKDDRRGERQYVTFTEQGPSFAPYAGKIYEQELTRAVIERFATHCSKLKPELIGDEATRPRVTSMVRGRPNRDMTWPTFLRRLAAMYEADGTAVVVPALTPDGTEVTGVWPLRFEYAEVVEYAGEPWVRFYFASGDDTAIELSNVAVLNKFQVDSDYFGEPNCLSQTMQLIHAQGEAEKKAIENGAKIRFIGAVNGMVREEDLRKKRERFVEDNLSAENTGGLMVYDQTFADVRQVDPASWVIDDAEMQRIQDNVFSYFGINQKILQSDFTEEQWDAYYESKVEPFALSLSEGLTHMCFGRTQIRRGNRIEFSSNRLEYATSASKRNMVRDMVDRGIMTINEAREVLQLPRIDGGDVFTYRGEYVKSDLAGNVLVQTGGQQTGGGNGRDPMNVADSDADIGAVDTFYKDSDGHNVVDEES